MTNSARCGFSFNEIRLFLDSFQAARRRSSASTSCVSSERRFSERRSCLCKPLAFCTRRTSASTSSSDSWYALLANDSTVTLLRFNCHFILLQSIPMLLAPLVLKTIVAQTFTVHQLQMAALPLILLTANAVGGLMAKGTSSQEKKAE